MAKGTFQTERPHMEAAYEGSAGVPACLGYVNWKVFWGAGEALQKGSSSCVGPCVAGRGIWPFAFVSWGRGRTYKVWSGEIRMTL